MKKKKSVETEDKQIIMNPFLIALHFEINHLFGTGNSIYGCWERYIKICSCMVAVKYDITFLT